MMSQVNCNIIKDILPLYADNVVSQDTRELVEQHLASCPQCRKEYTLTKQELVLPAEQEASLLKAIKRKWRNKKLRIAVSSALITCLIVITAYNFIFHYNTLVPYSESLIKIEEQDDGRLAAHFYGDSYYFVSATHPRSIEIDGEIKQVAFIYYTKTIADTYALNWFERDKTRNEEEFMFQLDNKQNIDAVYYAKFDSVKIHKNGDDWSSVLEDAVLIWQKD